MQIQGACRRADRATAPAPGALHRGQGDSRVPTSNELNASGGPPPAASGGASLAMAHPSRWDGGQRKGAQVAISWRVQTQVLGTVRIWTTPFWPHACMCVHTCDRSQS